MMNLFKLLAIPLWLRRQKGSSGDAAKSEPKSPAKISLDKKAKRWHISTRSMFWQKRYSKGILRNAVFSHSTQTVEGEFASESAELPHVITLQMRVEWDAEMIMFVSVDMNGQFAMVNSASYLALQEDGTFMAGWI